MERKWPVEELTEAEARRRHRDCELVGVFSIVDDRGKRRLAIFVWKREATADEEDPEALYWLRE